MRYTSSHPHAFRNRIAKSIGVLVAAALIATLGLPSAAQAQTINAANAEPPGVVFDDDVTNRGFTVNWMTRLADPKPNKDDGSWIVTFTPPGGSAVVVDRHTDNVRGIDDDALIS